ncbi:MAG: presenilin family intramembrane aspartyl protease [Candidatus Aenigmatarchaeota archaeon]
MKHNAKVVAALVSLFFIAQLFGLFVVSQEINVSVTPTGEYNVTYDETAIGPRPEVSGFESFLLVAVSILIGTGLILLFVKLGTVKLWKAMFFLAVFITITVSLGVFISTTIAMIIAAGLALLKVFKSNVYVHNLTEVLMYAGIALIFVPIFTIEWIIALLLVISVYDFYAVFKSKHMVSIAEFQTQSNVFAGLSIPYTIKTKTGKLKKKIKQTKTKAQTAVKEKVEVVEAILGGGDIAFPLLFAGVVMEGLIRTGGLSKEIAFAKALIIPIVVTIFLIGLFMYGKKGKYYPAMPVLTAGSLLGYAIVLLI